MPERGRIRAGHVVLKLALDVGQQRAGSQPEQARVQPVIAQLLFHQDHPVQGLLGRADAPRRLEAHLDAGALSVVADRPAHHQPDRRRRVDRRFAR